MILTSSLKNSTIVRSQNSIRFARAALQTAFIVSEELGTSLAERLFTTPRRHPRPDRERAVLASARELSIDVALRAPRWSGQHTTIRAWRWGHGPTVLLVHGWEGRGSQLGGFVEPLVAAGLSVAAFDAPGHGDSPGHRLYLPDLADCIADVAGVVGPLHATISHSFGCAAVLLAHARHGVDAARNVMVSPNVTIPDAFRRFARLVALDDADRGRLESALATHGGIPLDGLQLDRLAAPRDAGLLVFHDRADREVSFEHATELTAAWPAAQLVATDGLGHRRILRDRDVISRAVDYVRLGAPMPTSDLVREVDRYLDELDARTA